MCGYDVPMATCQGDWNGNNLPVLTIVEKEEYLTTPQNIIGYLVHQVNFYPFMNVLDKGKHKMQSQLRCLRLWTC